MVHKFGARVEERKRVHVTKLKLPALFSKKLMLTLGAEIMLILIELFMVRALSTDIARILGCLNP